MTRMEEVKYLRTEPNGRHYNCAQSLLVPFAEQVGLDKEQADKLGSFFGSGMLHGSACGALSATQMILGMAGYDSQQARQIIHDFRQRHQATDCTTLLTLAKEQGIPARTTATRWSLRWLSFWRRFLPPRASNPRKTPKREAPPDFPF